MDSADHKTRRASGKAQLWVNEETTSLAEPLPLDALAARIMLPRLDGPGRRPAGRRSGVQHGDSGARPATRAWLLSANDAKALALAPGENTLDELCPGCPHRLFVSADALVLVPARGAEDIAEVNGNRCIVPTNLKDGALLRLNGRPFRLSVL